MDLNGTKQAIKDATDIVDIVSQYTTLSPAGKRMKGLSPFTSEKTPSFFVDPDEGLYYCFSSQKGGDVFTFVQEVEGMTFREALVMLADRAGVQIDNQNTSEKGRETTHSEVYTILDQATKVYQKNLSQDKREHLKERGLTDESIDVWGIGYAPSSWQTLCNASMSKYDEYASAGLCIRKEKNVYDRFRNRNHVSIL